MPEQRWLLSALIVFHLVAISVAAIPPPGELNPIQLRHPPGDDALAAALMAILDRGAGWLARIEPHVFDMTEPVRQLTRPYIRIGLRQKWNMFSNPVTVEQYVRVDHYVVSSESPERFRVFQELALPAQREDRVRLIHKFRDKAVLNALETFSVMRATRAASDTLPRDLVPLARYFRNRFQNEYLDTDERVVRTDVWFGQAPIPLPGHRLGKAETEAHLKILERYWQGPSESVFPGTRPDPGAAQREGDLVWKLEYVDEP